MNNQPNYVFYYVPDCLTTDFQSVQHPFLLQRHLEVLILYSQSLQQEQNDLISQLTACNSEVQVARMENDQLRGVGVAEEAKTKRKYRKRRTWLQKKFRCNVKGCRGKYSSKIALNSHKRRKHPKNRAE